MCPQVHVLEEENISLAEQCSRLHANLETTDKDKHATEKKCAQVCMFNFSLPSFYNLLKLHVTDKFTIITHILKTVGHSFVSFTSSTLLVYLCTVTSAADMAGPFIICWPNCVPLHQLQTRLGHSLYVGLIVYHYISCRHGWAIHYMLA